MDSGCYKIRQSKTKLKVMTTTIHFRRKYSETEGARAVEAFLEDVELKYKQEGIDCEVSFVFTQHDQVQGLYTGIFIATHPISNRGISMYKITDGVNDLCERYRFRTVSAYYVNTMTDVNHLSYGDCLDISVGRNDNILIVSQYIDGMYTYYFSHSICRIISSNNQLRDMSFMEKMKEMLVPNVKASLEIVRKGGENRVFLTRENSRITFKYLRAVKESMIFSHHDCPLLSDDSEELASVLPKVLFLSSYCKNPLRRTHSVYLMVSKDKLELKNGEIFYNGMNIQSQTSVMPVDPNDDQKTRNFMVETLKCHSMGKRVEKAQWKNFMYDDECDTEDRASIIERFLTPQENVSEKAERAALSSRLADRLGALREVDARLSMWKTVEQKLQPLPYIPKLDKNEEKNMSYLHPMTRVRKVNGMVTLCLTANEEVIL